MDQTPEQNHPNEAAPTKKVWKEPQLFIISQANHPTIAGGIKNSAHEANFTPNHTHYITPSGSSGSPSAKTFPAAKFNNYVS